MLCACLMHYSGDRELLHLPRVTPSGPIGVV